MFVFYAIEKKNKYIYMLHNLFKNSALSTKTKIITHCQKKYAQFF